MTSGQQKPMRGVQTGVCKILDQRKDILAQDKDDSRSGSVVGEQKNDHKRFNLAKSCRRWTLIFPLFRREHWVKRQHLDNSRSGLVTLTLPFRAGSGSTGGHASSVPLSIVSCFSSDADFPGEASKNTSEIEARRKKADGKTERVCERVDGHAGGWGAPSDINLELAQRISSSLHRDSTRSMLRRARMVASGDHAPFPETDDWVASLRRPRGR